MIVLEKIYEEDWDSTDRSLCIGRFRTQEEAFEYIERYYPEAYPHFAKSGEMYYATRYSESGERLNFSLYHT